MRRPIRASNTVFQFGIPHSDNLRGFYVACEKPRACRVVFPDFRIELSGLESRGYFQSAMVAFGSFRRISYAACRIQGNQPQTQEYEHIRVCGYSGARSVRLLLGVRGGDGIAFRDEPCGIRFKRFAVSAYRLRRNVCMYAAHSRDIQVYDGRNAVQEKVRLAGLKTKSTIERTSAYPKSFLFVVY